MLVFVQWEFQVGPSVGISASDQVWVARYILEVLNVAINTESFTARTQGYFKTFIDALTEDH